ncbi:MAG: hypothetical protein ACI8Y7_000563 [Candidatus Woesearchaeota archaeon]|jgi:hypothetical protein
MNMFNGKDSWMQIIPYDKPGCVFSCDEDKVGVPANLDTAIDCRNFSTWFASVMGLAYAGVERYKVEHVLGELQAKGIHSARIHTPTPSIPRATGGFSKIADALNDNVADT